MSFARAVLIWRITALALAATYAIAGLVVLLGDWERRDTVVWVSLLLGGALLILIGVRALTLSPVLAGILVSVGAAAGTFFLFWLIVVPLAVAVVIALSVAIARQTSAAA